MRLDIVAGPGTQNPLGLPPGLACEAVPLQAAEPTVPEASTLPAVPLVAEGAITGASLLNVEAALMVAAQLGQAAFWEGLPPADPLKASGMDAGQGPPESQGGARDLPCPALSHAQADAFLATLTPNLLAEASEGPSPAEGPPLEAAAAPSLAAEAAWWKMRAEAAEGAASSWSDRLSQAESRWVAERDNLKHNHTMLQRAAAEQGFAQVRRSQRHSAIAFGLALAALLVGMPAAWLGGSQGAVVAAEPVEVTAVQAARAQGHQQVVDALAAQASAAVVAHDSAKARALYAAVADLASADEDREAARAALKALGQEGAQPPLATPRRAAAAAPAGSPTLGRLLVSENGTARLRVPLRRATSPAQEATSNGIPEGVRAKF